MMLITNTQALILETVQDFYNANFTLKYQVWVKLEQ